MLSQLLEKHNLKEFQKYFEARIGECWAGEAYKGQHVTGESKVGGFPDAAQDFVWPRFKDLPLEFICQIKCSDVELSTFPNEGLLLFFLCDGYWTDEVAEKDYIRVIWLSPDTKLIETAPPFVYQKRWFGLLTPRRIPKVFDEARLALSKNISIPDVEALDTDFSEKMDEKDEWDGYCEVKEEISGKRFIQIGGYPHPVQYDSIAETAAKSFGKGEASDWHMILEVAWSPHTNMMWGDAGRIHFFAHQSDIENRVFDNVWMEFQCH